MRKNKAVIKTCTTLPRFRLVEMTGFPEIEVRNTPVFREGLKEITKGFQDSEILVVDVTTIRYADSSFFGALLSAVKRIRPKRGRLVLVGANRAIVRILKITRLSDVFETIPTRSDFNREYQVDVNQPVAEKEIEMPVVKEE